MTRKFLPIALLFVFLLAACGSAAGAAAPTETVEPTAEPTAAATEAADSSQAATQEPLTDADNPCVTFSVIDNLFGGQYPNLPAVTSDDFSTGPANAAVTFIEYSEPQCPYCAQLNPIMVQLQEMYPDTVRVVFRLRPFPETFHNKSIIASQAMVAADMQGKFEEFKNFLFERQYQDTEDTEEAKMAATDFWSSLEPADLDGWLKEQVPALGIDADKLLEDMYSEEVVARVQADMASSDAIGVSATPTLFMNGAQFNDDWSNISNLASYVEVLSRLIEGQKTAFNTCPPTVTDAKKSYSATITTTKGDIVVDLFNDKAPVAVNSFVYLAQNGWYDNLPIIAAADFILSGDPSDTGYGGAGYAYLDEISADLNFDESGMLSTFSLGSGINGSAFFINKNALTGQGGRTIFGKVTSGMDVVNKLEIRDNIFNPVLDRVESITITEK
jgi:cyclophilin family peptidyl-prolyl cis-trans isomerase/protein-disulfide isomerase